MSFDLSVITANAIVIVPIVIAIVQAIKLTGFIPDHFSPLLAIVIGIIIGWLGDHDNADLTVTLLSGAVYGLMASGLYSGMKTTIQAHQQMKDKRAGKINPNRPNKF
jgi:F0F1-type ATP synthase assembly protein I